MDKAYVIYFNNGYLRAGYNHSQSLYLATMYKTEQEAQDDINRKKELWTDMENAKVVEVTAE